MAADRPPVGIDHLTVVPATRDDEGESETEPADRPQ
jgi:hypothetical protein